MEPSPKYNAILANTSLFSLWWGYQLGLSALNLFSEHPFVFPLSATFGCIALGFYIERLSRIRALTVSSIVGSVAAIFEGVGLAFKLLPVYYIGRIISGIVSGCLCVFVLVYLREVTPLTMSGKVASVTQLCIATGTFMSYVLNETCTYYTDSFAFNLLLPILPCFATLISAALMHSTMKYESPIYLWSLNKPNLALQTLKELAGEQLRNSMVDYEEESEVPVNTKHVSRTYKEIFVNPILRKVLGQVCLTAFLQQTTGINSVIIYSSYFWREDFGLPYAGSLISCIAAMSVIPSFLYIDKVPRKRLIQAGALVMMACNAIMAAMMSNVIVSFCTSVIFVLSFELTMGPAMWVCFNELAFPKSLCLACACNWFGVASVSVLSRAAYYNSVFDIIERSVYAFFCFVLFIIATKLFVETKSDNSSEIEKRLCMNAET
mmetsp:Transcript_14181/g.26682  ORF Transcript_14181/g.26682 Transcript_14181/m.26682 type:complete len:435 (+) Transcript_14181:3-1307(+)